MPDVLPSSATAVEALCPSPLSYQGPALDGFDRLAATRSNVELLRTAHSMWCGDCCPRDFSCSFLYCNRPEPSSAAGTPRAVRPCYNKDTARLFTLMGGDGYAPNTPQTHQVSTWPLLEAVLRRADRVRGGGALLFCDYTDWSKDDTGVARTIVERSCRDAVQWMGLWCGKRCIDATGVQCIAFLSLTDDLCVPPLDIMRGRLRMYGRSARDLVEAMVTEGWGRDANYVLLTMVRQALAQYAEKIDFEDLGGGQIGLHAQLSHSGSVWDSIVFRTHTANTHGAAVVVARTLGVGPLSDAWINDCSVCDCISMDLAKSVARIYEQDKYQPTAIVGGPKPPNAERLRRRQAGYHSVYLDLIDDLVNSGAPEPVVHFAAAGFLFVPIHHRYLERRMGGRFPIHSAMADELRRIFGESPTDSRVDGLFRLRWLAGRGDEDSLGARPQLCSALVSACRERQRQRRWACALDGARDGPCRFGRVENAKHVPCGCADAWIAAIHNLSRQAGSPGELRRSLTSSTRNDAWRLSGHDLDAVGSPDDVWALCVACQVDCGDSCEWLAFARHAWKRFGAREHASSQGCPGRVAMGGRSELKAVTSIHRGAWE